MLVLVLVLMDRSVGRSSNLQLSRHSLHPFLSFFLSSSPLGKLRLLYEAAPMSFLVEQAGGLALTGKNRIMEIRPKVGWVGRVGRVGRVVRQKREKGADTSQV